MQLDLCMASISRGMDCNHDNPTITLKELSKWDSGGSPSFPTWSDRLNQGQQLQPWALKFMQDIFSSQRRQTWEPRPSNGS